jgi:hypothetical protein
VCKQIGTSKTRGIIVAIFSNIFRENTEKPSLAADRRLPVNLLPVFTQHPPQKKKKSPKKKLSKKEVSCMLLALA